MINRKYMTGLGPTESELIASFSAKGIRVFSVAMAAEELGIGTGPASDMVVRLQRKKKLQRIEKGKYLIMPPEAWKSGEYSEEGIVIASQLISPYYLSYWTALSFYGWTEQPSSTIFVVSTRVKLPVEIQGMTIRFVKLKSERFFGFLQHWVGNQKVLVAEKEKAIVDCLDQPRYSGEIVEVVKGLWNGRKELDFSKMLDYSIRMHNKAIIRRMGYLMDVLEIRIPEVRDKALKHVTANVTQLDPGRGDSGEIDKDWNILINVKPSNLTEWITH